MNWNLIAKLGFKIIATLAAGYAVWRGVGKVMTKKKPKPQPVLRNPEEPTVSQTIMDGLHTTTNTCGKINAVMGAVTATADAIYTVFGENQNQYYCNGYYGGYQPNGFRRTSPLIVETNRSGINTQGYRY